MPYLERLREPPVTAGGVGMVVDERLPGSERTRNKLSADGRCEGRLTNHRALHRDDDGRDGGFHAPSECPLTLAHERQ